MVASVDEAAAPYAAASDVADACLAAGEPFDEIAEAGRVLDVLADMA
jgi:hypothetical protein